MIFRRIAAFCLFFLKQYYLRQKEIMYLNYCFHLLTCLYLLGSSSPETLL